MGEALKRKSLASKNFDESLSICQRKWNIYCTADFLREDFNHVNGLIREIKIHVVFNTLHFVSRLQ